MTSPSRGRDTVAQPVPVAAPPRVEARLAACPDGPVKVLHATPDLVHLDVPGGAVAVAAAGAPGLPHALRSNLGTVFVRGSSADLPTAYVDSGILHLDGRALVTGRLVDVRAPRLDAARISQTSPAFAQGTPRSRVAGLVAAVRAGGVQGFDPTLGGRLERLVHIDARAVRQLVGLGEGLTPLGDDVVCGWLAVHRSASVATDDVDDAVRLSLPRTTSVSASLLECALAGEVADLVAGYLRALGTPRASAARAALTTLGHSSGSGLAHGIDLAVGQLAGRLAA